jgi:hypothetical protein
MNLIPFCLEATVAPEIYLVDDHTDQQNLFATFLHVAHQILQSKQTIQLLSNITCKIQTMSVRDCIFKLLRE